MQKILLLTITFYSSVLYAQPILNTAANCKYMQADERAMIHELNKLRHNPKSYLADVEPLLAKAKDDLKKYGRGEKNYALATTTSSSFGKTSVQIDTIWYYMQEEEVNALATLVNDLKKTKPLSILQPDSGIYKGAKKHAADQSVHRWELAHTGSDGSQPWDRVTTFSTKMATGNENLAGRFPLVNPRQIVLQLLIDSGIRGYGHRYNMLNPQWTHVACVSAGLHEGMFRWIQNFGQSK